MDSREASRMSSGEPPGIMVNPNSYVMPNTSNMMSGMQLNFNQVESQSNLFHNSDGNMQSLRQGGGNNFFSMSEPMMKKKRGRPRKYGQDGNVPLQLSPISSNPPGYTNPNLNLNTNSSGSILDPNAKKRGRPLGSGKKQQLDALGSAGIAFTPHVLNVKAGEDVAAKIYAFSQQGPRTVSIISANGSICNVTLRQPSTSGGTITYEGRFDIISLSGSFVLTEDGGTRSRTGGLSVSLAGSNGRVLGGSVAGMLMAASPVLVVVGSFIAEGKKPKLELKREPQFTVPTAPPPMTGFTGVPPSSSSPPSQAETPSESEDDDNDNDDDDGDDSGSPAMNLSSSVGGAYNNTSHAMNSYASVDGGWSHSMSHHHHQSRHG